MTVNIKRRNLKKDLSSESTQTQVPMSCFVNATKILVIATYACLVYIVPKVSMSALLSGRTSYVT